MCNMGKVFYNYMNNLELKIENSGFAIVLEVSSKPEVCQIV